MSVFFNHTLALVRILDLELVLDELCVRAEVLPQAFRVLGVRLQQPIAFGRFMMRFKDASAPF